MEAPLIFLSAAAGAGRPRAFPRLIDTDGSLSSDNISELIASPMPSSS
ncbi:MAG: hypothetical protein ACI8XO_003479, partial [Verrucomicrobiales bacterium]